MRLRTLIEENWPDRRLFSLTPAVVEEIWGHLAADGHRVGLWAERSRKTSHVLDGFTRRDLDILVATGVAAHGLHIHNNGTSLLDLPDGYYVSPYWSNRSRRPQRPLLAWRVKYALNLPAVDLYWCSIQ